MSDIFYVISYYKFKKYLDIQGIQKFVDTPIICQCVGVEQPNS